MPAYRFWADVVVLVHALYVAFVVAGLVVVLVGAALRWRWIRNFWFRIVHLSMIGIVVMESLAGMVCPLTTWEAALREKAGDDALYPGSFLGRCIHSWLFYDIPDWVASTAYCLFGAAVLAAMIWIPPARPWARKGCGLRVLRS